MFGPANRAGEPRAVDRRFDDDDDDDASMNWRLIDRSRSFVVNRSQSVSADDMTRRERLRTQRVRFVERLTKMAGIAQCRKAGLAASVSVRCIGGSVSGNQLDGQLSPLWQAKYRWNFLPPAYGGDVNWRMPTAR